MMVFLGERASIEGWLFVSRKRGKIETSQNGPQKLLAILLLI